MITTSSSAFVIESGSQSKYDGANILCEPVYYELRQSFAVTPRIQDSSTTNFIGSGQMEVTKTEVDAETGSGSGETAPWFDALQKAVKTKLSAMTGNGSVTFTIV